MYNNNRMLYSLTLSAILILVGVKLIKTTKDINLILRTKLLKIHWCWHGFCWFRFTRFRI